MYSYRHDYRDFWQRKQAAFKEVPQNTEISESLHRCHRTAPPTMGLPQRLWGRLAPRGTQRLPNAEMSTVASYCHTHSSQSPTETLLSLPDLIEISDSQRPYTATSVWQPHTEYGEKTDTAHWNTQTLTRFPKDLTYFIPQRCPLKRSPHKICTDLIKKLIQGECGLLSHRNHTLGDVTMTFHRDHTHSLVGYPNVLPQKTYTKSLGFVTMACHKEPGDLTMTAHRDHKNSH
jgi:hypothetical protein